MGISGMYYRILLCGETHLIYRYKIPITLLKYIKYLKYHTVVKFVMK